MFAITSNHPANTDRRMLNHTVEWGKTAKRGSDLDNAVHSFHRYHQEWLPCCVVVTGKKTSNGVDAYLDFARLILIRLLGEASSDATPTQS